MTDLSAGRRTYMWAWVGLMLLTGLTTGVAFVDLGTFSTVLAIGIAGLKAVLIVFFFMHLTRGPVLTRVVVAGALIWLSMLVLLTFTDYFTRGWLPVPGK